MEVVMLEAGLKLKRRGDLRGRFLQDYCCAVHCKALRRTSHVFCGDDCPREPQLPSRCSRCFTGSRSWFIRRRILRANRAHRGYLWCADQSYNWNSRRVVVDPPTAAQRAAADEEARRQEKAGDAAGTTSGASNTASATTQASAGSINGSYSTTFPLTENPIGEGGSWTNGGATGLGWANVQTTPGLSFGTGPINADPTAVLKGAWAQDQQVQATVKVPGAYGRACCKEVELRIRTTITRNSITGYELNCSVVSAVPYLSLVRWNGSLNNFTYVVNNATTCVNGDILKLTAIGNTFTVYKNGVQVLQGTDGTFKRGSPGVGFYNSVDTNWSGFGLSNFSASNAGSSDTTPPRIQD